MRWRRRWRSSRSLKANFDLTRCASGCRRSAGSGVPRHRRRDAGAGAGERPALAASDARRRTATSPPGGSRRSSGPAGVIRWAASAALEAALPDSRVVAVDALRGLLDQLRAQPDPGARLAQGRTLEAIAERTRRAAGVPVPARGGAGVLGGGRSCSRATDAGRPGRGPGESDAFVAPGAALDADRGAHRRGQAGRGSAAAGGAAADLAADEYDAISTADRLRLDPGG